MARATSETTRMLRNRRLPEPPLEPRSASLSAEARFGVVGPGIVGNYTVVTPVVVKVMW